MHYYLITDQFVIILCNRPTSFHNYVLLSEKISSVVKFMFQGNLLKHAYFRKNEIINCICMKVDHSNDIFSNDRVVDDYIRGFFILFGNKINIYTVAIWL